MAAAALAASNASAALPVVRLAVVDSGRITAVSDPRHATFTMYSFLKSVPPAHEVEGCYGDFKRHVKASEGGDTFRSMSGIRGGGGGGGGGMRSPQCTRIVNAAEAVTSNIFSKPAPAGLHPMGFAFGGGGYSMYGDTSSAFSDREAQQRRQRIFTAFLKGTQQSKHDGSGRPPATVGVRSPLDAQARRLINNDGDNSAEEGATNQKGGVSIPTQHFSSMAAPPNTLPNAGNSSSYLPISSPLSADPSSLVNASGTAKSDSGIGGGRAGGGGYRYGDGDLLSGNAQPADSLLQISGGGGRLQQSKHDAASDAVVNTLASPLQQRDGHGHGGGRQGDGRSPSQRLDFTSTHDGAAAGVGVRSPQQQERNSSNAHDASSSLPHQQQQQQYSPHLATVLRDVHDGIRRDPTLSSRDMAARNEKDMLNNNAIDLFARIAAVKNSVNAAPEDTTNDPTLLHAICDGLTARLRNVQLFHVLQRHEEETLKIADMALRAECEAMKRQLRDVISALVRSEGRLTGDDDSLPPSDGRYVSEHFLFEQIQDVLQEASAVV